MAQKLIWKKSGKHWMGVVPSSKEVLFILTYSVDFPLWSEKRIPFFQATMVSPGKDDVIKIGHPAHSVPALRNKMDRLFATLERIIT